MADTLFFDLDGTLIDSQPGIAASIRHTMEILGHPSPTKQLLNRCFGPPIRDSFSRLLGTSEPALIEQAVALFRQNYLAEGIHQYRVYPQIQTLLEALQQHPTALIVLSAKPQSQVEWIVADAGLAQHFDAIHGSKDRGPQSCKTRHLSLLLRTNELRPERCLLVGDRDLDMQAAQTNGVGGVAVGWGYAQPGEFEQCGFDYRVDSPLELMALIDELLRR